MPDQRQALVRSPNIRGYRTRTGTETEFYVIVDSVDGLKSMMMSSMETVIRICCSN